ncbi:hypothetical protein NECID01_0457 [Nematocida sp. AWRm77]|nr:hypothetical protein NECID01_0457 [Nematocida sp. AWRm77]
MTSALQEYRALLHSRPLSSKYTVKALQIVAETNEHHAQEIVKAIEQAMEEASVQDKEVLAGLLRALSQHYKYAPLTGASTPSTKRKKSVKEEPAKKECREKENGSSPQSAEEMFLPYPPEYYLFKMVEKKKYLASYLFYTRTEQTAQEDAETEPSLSREYFIVPRLHTAQKMLYSTGMQCKVCGMRFSTGEALMAHGELHQRRNKMDKSVVGRLSRPWLLEPKEWTDPQPRTPKVSLYTALPDETDNVLVQGDREQKCSICKDPFDIVWSDDEESWVFKDALQVRTSPRQICHKRCVI